MSFDVDKILRWLKPEKRKEPLSPRSLKALQAANPAPVRGPLLLDTTVYVHAGQGKLPQPLAEMIQTRPLYHSAVVLGEIAHGLGRLDPNHPLTEARKTYLRSVLDKIPHHRVLTPDAESHLCAGLTVGLLSRLQSMPAGSHRSLINDALIFLSALKHGACVVTANSQDFDLLQQVIPTGKLYFY